MIFNYIWPVNIWWACQIYERSILNRLFMCVRSKMSMEIETCRCDQSCTLQIGWGNLVFHDMYFWQVCQSCLSWKTQIANWFDYCRNRVFPKCFHWIKWQKIILLSKNCWTRTHYHLCERQGLYHFATDTTGRKNS